MTTVRRADGACPGATAIPKLAEPTCTGASARGVFAAMLMGVTVLLAFATKAVSPSGAIAMPSGCVTLPTENAASGVAGVVARLIGVTVSSLFAVYAILPFGVMAIPRVRWARRSRPRGSACRTPKLMGVTTLPLATYAVRPFGAIAIACGALVSCSERDRARRRVDHAD